MVTAARSRTTRVSSAGGGAIRSYESALKYLGEQTNYELMPRVRYNPAMFSLERMHRLMKKLGDPQSKVRAVHIAGTKGKGSTATMLATMLRSCGYKVGLYTSPHIVDVRERIQVNGEMISQAAMTRQIARLKPIAEKMGDDRPTFFELVTAMALCHFADSGVDVAVIETGMGGRLDSTNVVNPAVCGFTSISLDHTHQLGTSLQEIAAEKAGILKSNTPAVSVAQEPEAREVLRRAARETNAPLMFTGDDIEFSYRVESNRQDGCHTRICLTTPRSRFEHIPVPLMGEHQAVNCGLALALLDQLKGQGLAIDDQRAMSGLAGVYLPGRMEIIREDPRVLVDGAHNPASMRALMRAIGQHIPYDSMVMVFGCAGDKDADGMIAEIATGADKLIFTPISNNPRSADPKLLAEIYERRSGRVAQLAASLAEALQGACNAVSRGDLICVCGSFGLVGETKQILGN